MKTIKLQQRIVHVLCDNDRPVAVFTDPGEASNRLRAEQGMAIEAKRLGARHVAKWSLVTVEFKA